MKKIKILGAGISGLVAAINLAKAGYEVDIYEKNKDVGMRFHGDLQGLENWSEKEDVLEELKKMNIEINFDCDPFSVTTLINGAKTKDIITKKPFYYLVKRGAFHGALDCGLKEQALKSGVNIYFQSALLPEEADIVATGPIPNKIFGIAKGIIFKTNFKDIAIAAVDDKLAFKGYSYLLITKGYGCMCSMVTDDLARIHKCFEETRRFFEQKFGLDIQSPKNVGGVGGFSLDNEFKKGNSLYVGEAAGLQDLLWGFGMRFAAQSGYLASQSIIKNTDYEKAAKKQFGNKLKASMVNRYLWDKIAKKDYAPLIDNADFMLKHLYSAHNYNLFQRALYPLAMRSLKKRINL